MPVFRCLSITVLPSPLLLSGSSSFSSSHASRPRLFSPGVFAAASAEGRRMRLSLRPRCRARLARRESVNPRKVMNGHAHLITAHQGIALPPLCSPLCRREQFAATSLNPTVDHDIQFIQRVPSTSSSHFLFVSQPTAALRILRLLRCEDVIRPSQSWCGFADAIRYHVSALAIPSEATSDISRRPWRIGWLWKSSYYVTRMPSNCSPLMSKYYHCIRFVVADAISADPRFPVGSSKPTVAALRKISRPRVRFHSVSFFSCVTLSTYHAA